MLQHFFYIFLLLALPFDQLENFEKSIYFVFTNARRKRRIFEHVRFSATKQKAAFGSASQIFFKFQLGNLHQHSVYDIKQWSSDQTMPKVWKKMVKFAR